MLFLGMVLAERLDLSGQRGVALKFSLLTRLSPASIIDERGLRRYVIHLAAVCVAIALAVDVANQLTFFVDWATSLRSWAITVTLVLALAVPISRTIGRAHLELYRAKLLADELSRTDQLTGLPNRRAFMDALLSARPEALALVIVDIDWFKRVNDTYGHLAGDAVIRSLGQMMAAELSPFGSVARVGGEEFALVSSGASAEALSARLNAFRDRVGSTPILANGSAVSVTISAGIALRGHGDTFDRLFSDADRALYAAKASGRNRVRLSSAPDALPERNGPVRPEKSADPLLRSA
jgi:diguanylate cyclase (GGDEF)-like protein